MERIKSMKTLLPIIMILLTCQAFSQNIMLQESPEICSKSKIASYKQAIEGYNNSKGVGDMYDIKYHRFEWNIDPEVKFIEGSVTTYFITTSADIPFLTFDLSDTLTVDSVIYNGTSCSTLNIDDVLTITLPATIPLGQLDSVTIWYHGEPRANLRAFTQSTYNSHPMVWTLSEPYGSKEWWPCKHDLNDKADSIDVFVTAPVGNKVASNGVLISETIVDTTVTVHWKHRHPIAAYLVAIAVSDYVEYSEYLVIGPDDSIHILNYVFAEDSAAIAEATPVTAESMELFNTFFTVYPFKDEKYGHCQFDWPGGMEHQTMSFMGAFGYEIIAHELAHMWFGDFITCGSWKDIWLNEAFATYLSGWGYQYLFNGIYWNLWLSIQIDRITQEPDGSVAITDTTDVERMFSARLTYRKGAALLHMLRWELTDSVWYQAIKNYLNDPLLANGYAKTEHLVGHFEAAGDTSLTEFMNDWYYGEGYPMYQIHWIQDVSNHVTVTVDQTQSHPSVSFYEMHLPLVFYGYNESLLTDTFRVMHSSSGQVYEFDLDYTIDSLVLDPELWLLQKNPIIEGVPFEEVEQNITVMPNPVSDMLYIKTKSPLFLEEVIIFDPRGKVFFSQKIEKTDQVFQIDLTTVPKGTYIVKMVTTGHDYNKKIIKQ